MSSIKIAMAPERDESRQETALAGVGPTPGWHCHPVAPSRGVCVRGMEAGAA